MADGAEKKPEARKLVSKVLVMGSAVGVQLEAEQFGEQRPKAEC